MRICEEVQAGDMTYSNGTKAVRDAEEALACTLEPVRKLSEERGGAGKRVCRNPSRARYTSERRDTSNCESHDHDGSSFEAYGPRSGLADSRLLRLVHRPGNRLRSRCEGGRY